MPSNINLSEVQTLKAEIRNTDPETDTMVCELHGVNQQEIAIVEEE